MPRKAIISLALALAATGSAAPLASARDQAPTKAQVKTAIRQAQRSSYLWATINVCSSSKHPNYIGIRGEMPGLGFTARLYMDVRVEYWSDVDNRFVAVLDAKGKPVHNLVSLGRATHGVHQGGVLFQFNPHAGILRGAITFEWKRSGKLLGKAIRKTGHGHPDAAYGEPAHFSAGTCTIG